MTMLEAMASTQDTTQAMYQSGYLFDVMSPRDDDLADMYIAGVRDRLREQGLTPIPFGIRGIDLYCSVLGFVATGDVKSFWDREKATEELLRLMDCPVLADAAIRGARRATRS